MRSPAGEWGRFGARWDGGMVAFTVAIPRRVTLAEAADLCASLLRAVSEVTDESDKDMVRCALAELSEQMTVTP